MFSETELKLKVIELEEASEMLNDFGMIEASAAVDVVVAVLRYVIDGKI